MFFFLASQIDREAAFCVLFGFTPENAGFGDLSPADLTLLVSFPGDRRAPCELPFQTTENPSQEILVKIEPLKRDENSPGSSSSSDETMYVVSGPQAPILSIDSSLRLVSP